MKTGAESIDIIAEKEVTLAAELQMKTWFCQHEKVSHLVLWSI